MPKSKRDDDSAIVLELLELLRDYLVDVGALAVLRAKQVREISCDTADAMGTLNEEISRSEQVIVARLKEHFENERKPS